MSRRKRKDGKEKRQRKKKKKKVKERGGKQGRRKEVKEPWSREKKGKSESSDKTALKGRQAWQQQWQELSLSRRFRPAAIGSFVWEGKREFVD